MQQKTVDGCPLHNKGQVLRPHRGSSRHRASAYSQNWKYAKNPHCCKMLQSDNQSCIKLVRNPVLHALTKHIELQHHFIREKTFARGIEFSYVPAALQQADVLTKPLSASQHNLQSLEQEHTCLPFTISERHCSQTLLLKSTCFPGQDWPCMWFFQLSLGTTSPGQNSAEGRVQKIVKNVHQL